MHRTMRALLAGAALCLGLGAPVAPDASWTLAPAAQAADVDINFEKFTLPNGLRVVVHEDRKAPVVAVSVWYHVGAKDEPKGKSGFAHLFEHLMFNGSENYDGEWFTPLEEVGATDLNGTTWYDRTNYFQTVPTTALDRVLWMESDRMGHLLGAVTQDKLDEQRDVVKNEKRQGENQPYGRAFYRIVERLFPYDHPYNNNVIGSMEDLNAASLEDVKDWFRTYYGPNNAVLVLAGDIDAKSARPLVEKYFGDIEAGPPLTRTTAMVPDRGANAYEVMEDRVPQTRLYRVWAVPGQTTRTARELEVAGNILGGGKNSRLYKRLVYDLQIATRVSLYMYDLELTNLVGIQIDVKPGESVERARAELDMILETFRDKGPTRAEVELVKTKTTADMIRGLEKVGGFGGKAVTLARGELYAGDPGFYQQRLDWIDAATPASTKAAARRWMGDGFFELTVEPFDKFSAADEGADRSALPSVDDAPGLTFPAVEQATLSNGMKVVFARRDTIPVVEMSVQFDAGYAADKSVKLGTASYTMAMLEEGTEKKNALEVVAEAERLGAELSAGSNVDVSSVSLSALKENLDPSIELMAEVIRQPGFRDEDIERLRQRWLARISQEKANPVPLALRLLPSLMYGEDHAYGVPLTGSGTEASIKSLSATDLSTFHKTWLRPDNATVFVVGDTTLDAITPLLEKHLGDWKAPGTDKPSKNIADVTVPDEPRIFIVDRPGSPQSLILAGHVAPPSGAENNVAIEALNDILGGEFSARVNMNLRETKGWAYGAYTFLFDAEAQRPFLAYAPVQTDKTAESINELITEFNAIRKNRPATQEELTRVVLNSTRSLPGSYETSGSVLGSLISSHRFGRPYDYPSTLPAAYKALDLKAINKTAQELIRPGGIVWLVIGDRAQIEDKIRALDLAPVALMDTDGTIID
ncbi:MAG: M16 family metallopeptidase [Alphaproteobacteria bacterium]